VRFTVDEELSDDGKVQFQSRHHEAHRGHIAAEAELTGRSARTTYGGGATSGAGSEVPCSRRVSKDRKTPWRGQPQGSPAKPLTGRQRASA
jgi:hypothetical protein